MNDVITSVLDPLRLVGQWALLAIFYYAVFKLISRQRGSSSPDLTSRGSGGDGGDCGGDSGGDCGGGGGDSGGDSGGDCGGDSGGDCGGGGGE